MRLLDGFGFGWQALTGYRARTSLMLLATAIGVASVIVLTSLGEGARRYVTDQFASLGSNLLIVLPGRTETKGGAPPLVGDTPRNLTLDDALAIGRDPAIRRVAPIIPGSVPVSHAGLEREVMIAGTTREFFTIRRLTAARGQLLPAGDPRHGASVAVIGSKIESELFPDGSALGQWLRIEDRRYRVIGIIAEKGRSLGLDLDDMVLIPVAAAQALFNTESLFRIFCEARSRDGLDQAEAAIRATLIDRHDGEEDFTIISQQAILSTFDRILGALTITLGGIAAISLVVAGILIMNIMLVAVAQRRAEVGLLKALGAAPRQIRRLFLIEASLLALGGGLVGLLVGFAGSELIGWLYPAFPLQPPWWAVIAALLVSISTGLLFGWLPAKRAAQLDPIVALSGR